MQVNAQRAAKPPLRVASHVVELEIPGLRPPVTYEKEIQCDMPAKKLEGITEGDEDNWQDDFDNRFDQVARSVQE